MRNRLRLFLQIFRLNSQLLRLNTTGSWGNLKDITIIHNRNREREQTGTKKTSLESSLFLFPSLSTPSFIYYNSSVQRATIFQFFNTLLHVLLVSIILIFEAILFFFIEINSFRHKMYIEGSGGYHKIKLL